MNNLFRQYQPFPKRQVLGSSKFKAFTDGDFEFNGMVESSPKRKHCGKRRNCSLPAISPFPTVFTKDL